jgi:hypothetical protein
VIVMPANNTGVRVGYLAGRFTGKIGHLYSPGAQVGPLEFIPYGLDNGAFGHDDDWDENAWMHLLDWAQISGQKPLWDLIPDRVGDKAATLERWEKFAPVARLFGWPLAFAVQDGMTPKDVPKSAAVVFVGGSTDWKWRTVGMWCGYFPRVHVGRVNSYRRLWECHDAGAESVDGTGWMRGDQVQYRGLMAYLEESTGVRERVLQHKLFGGSNAVCVY